MYVCVRSYVCMHVCMVVCVRFDGCCDEAEKIYFCVLAKSCLKSLVEFFVESFVKLFAKSIVRSVVGALCELPC